MLAAALRARQTPWWRRVLSTAAKAPAPTLSKADLALLAENATITPRLSSPAMAPVAAAPHKPVPNGELAVISGIPEAVHARALRIFKPEPNAMQAGTYSYKAWRVEFDRDIKWPYPLMGWAQTSDPVGHTGTRTMRFDTKEQAIAFVESMGFKYNVVEPTEKRSYMGHKGYDKNFLNDYVKKRMDRGVPAVVMRTQFGHPERGKPTWANLGNLATQYGTSTHNTKAQVKAVSQSYWDSNEFDKHDTKSWRHDYFAKASELAKKLGK